MMDNSMRNALIFSMLPAAAVAIGGVMFFYKPPSPGLLGGVRKFAAGALVGVMALELLPDFLYGHSFKALLALAVGGVLMFGVRWAIRKLSALGWDALQVLIAGLLIGSGFVAGFGEGLLLTITFVIQALAIGLFAASVMSRTGASRNLVLTTIALLSALIVVGAAAGGTSIWTRAGIDLDMAFAFGMAAPLLWAMEGLVETRGEYSTDGSLIYFVVGIVLFLLLAWWLGGKHSDHPGRRMGRQSSIQYRWSGEMSEPFGKSIISTRSTALCYVKVLGLEYVGVSARTPTTVRTSSDTVLMRRPRQSLRTGIRVRLAQEVNLTGEA